MIGSLLSLLKGLEHYGRMYVLFFLSNQRTSDVPVCVADCDGSAFAY